MIISAILYDGEDEWNIGVLACVLGQVIETLHKHMSEAPPMDEEALVQQITLPQTGARCYDNGRRLQQAREHATPSRFIMLKSKGAHISN